ncbi:LacI family DNA-binding transcriptional regulator, partial [Streptomyces albidoflavus]|uniref:LacI family DNA-binding transcriptional regulator n=1 Tax=Streptomyces albidoflavus TaxID=1886 RepID=UPI004055F609
MEEARKRARRGRTPSPAGRTSRPRQAEVARLAGVSQATVSLVLGARKQGVAISEETRQKVLDAVRALGYVPDPGGGGGAGGGPYNLGRVSMSSSFPP